MRYVWISWCCLTLAGCKELTGSQSLPAGTASPASYDTPAGAMGMRNEAIADLQRAVRSYLIDTGLLTDELESKNVGASAGLIESTTLPIGGSLDARILPEFTTAPYTTPAADIDYENLQNVRGELNQALGALAAYDTARADTATSKVFRGELYALQGYTEILLADFFCSGVPLSTLDFQQDFTYRPSSTTAQVYQAALAKLDTALTLADTSTQVLNLARVLQGRAFLALGEYPQAAQAVTLVPDQFQYQLAIQFTSPGQSDNNDLNDSATVADREGETGLPYVSSHDPRVGLLATPANGLTGVAPPLFPEKYAATFSASGFAPFTVADGIEARLIRAEAALQAHDTVTWLAQLNYLREHALVVGQTTTLPDTTDPGTTPNDSARVSLTFYERAFWLFLTGHRQGDMRRLIRQYHRDMETVYPTGPYHAPGAARYGTDVTAPIPASERPNPYFHGCLDRNA